MSSILAADQVKPPFKLQNQSLQKEQLLASIFQNPQNADGVSDYTIYQQDMALAFAAEGLGYESVWGVEHHFTDYTMTPDPVQFLAAVGGHSKKIKLGTMVVVLPWNDPMRVAEKISMLDCIDFQYMCLWGIRLNVKYYFR